MKISESYKIKLINYLAFSLVFFSLFSCTSTDNYIPFFKRTEVQTLLHGIDQRETEAVTPFLKSENDSLVLMALNGCISIGDSTLIPALTPLLNHSNLKLISTATLALGATEHPSAADSLLSRYKADKSLGSPELWYALGRTVNAEQYDDALKLAKTAPDSEASNWLLYWSSLRGITSSSAIEMALSSYVSVEKEQRLAAASFLSRSPNSSLGAEHKGLVQFFKAENDPEVRAALALAFRHDNVLGTMDVMKMLLNEKDERCQASLLRAAWKNQLLGPEDVMPLLTPQEHPLVRSSVSNWLKDQVWTEATYEYFSENFNPKDSVVSPHLLTGIIRYHEGSDFWQEKAKQLVSSSLSNYTKAAYVKCLEGQSDEVTYLINLMDESNSSPIRTAAAETLIATHKFGKWTNPISILDAMEIAFASGDPTLLSLFAIHLADPEMDFKTSFTNHDWLQNALQKLSLPEETESERDIKRALAYLNDENFIVPDPVYNYPPVFTNLYDTKTIVAVIKTSKGEVTMHLDPYAAPITINDFIAKGKEGYYDGKFFHRVVPNFVIQGGCKRGDGWGSEDYTLRSEFSAMKYREGTIGKASVGKDTEGVQWFITHSATPHLEWGYTCFGQVAEGMEVVRSIQIGDEIIGIEFP